MPLIVMGQLFNLKDGDFGPWNSGNFFMYQLVAYNLTIVYGISNAYPAELRQEKIWMTLPALIIAPFKQIYLIFGIYLSFLMVIAIPFTMFFVLAFI